MREIKIITHDSGVFEVIQGDKTSEELSYDETIGLLTALIMPENRPCLQWMKTKENHNKIRECCKKSSEQVDSMLNLNEIRGVKIHLPKTYDQLMFQDKCFKLGLKWRDGTNKNREIGNPLMYIDENMVMKHCALYKQYSNLKYKEINIDQILKL